MFSICFKELKCYFDYIINRFTSFKYVLCHFNRTKQRVSDWLIFNAKWSDSQLYHGKNKIISIRCWWWWPLCTSLTIFDRFHMSLYSDTLSWFRRVFALLNVEKKQHEMYKDKEINVVFVLSRLVLMYITIERGFFYFTI